MRLSTTARRRIPYWFISALSSNIVFNHVFCEILINCDAKNFQIPCLFEVNRSLFDKARRLAILEYDGQNQASFIHVLWTIVSLDYIEV